MSIVLTYSNNTTENIERYFKPDNSVFSYASYISGQDGFIVGDKYVKEKLLVLEGTQNFSTVSAAYSFINSWLSKVNTITKITFYSSAFYEINDGYFYYEFVFSQRELKYKLVLVPKTTVLIIVATTDSARVNYSQAN